MCEYISTHSSTGYSDLIVLDQLKNEKTDKKESVVGMIRYNGNPPKPPVVEMSKSPSLASQLLPAFVAGRPRTLGASSVVLRQSLVSDFAASNNVFGMILSGK